MQLFVVLSVFFFLTQLHPDSHSCSSVSMLTAMYNGQNLDSEFTI